MAYLEIKDLKVSFKVPGSHQALRAVDGVSLQLEKGQSLGVVGESGCGKSTLANAILRLVQPDSGSIHFEGQDALVLKGKALGKFREKVQMVFQDPFGSLNPRMTAGSCISEVLSVHGMAGKAKINERTIELLGMVGLDATYAARYPHEFSGGQRQRIGIARALAVAPSLIIADEPVSALDVSVQVQILNLMSDLRRKMGLSYLFIAHDLSVVRYMCRDLLVMYLGKIVESGVTAEVFDRPSHPYAEALLSAVPDVEKGLRSRAGKVDRIILQGDVPSPTERIDGCPFHPRCHRAQDVCLEKVPALQEVSAGRMSACHFAEDMMAR
jgi:oligopeptide/dipeptide ABC transporter ATP-binding protein